MAEPNAGQECFQGSCLAEAGTHGCALNPLASAGKYPSPAAAGIKPAEAAQFDLPGSPGIELHDSLSPVESRPCRRNHHTLAPPPALSSAEFRGSGLREDLALHLADPGGPATPATRLHERTGKYIPVPYAAATASCTIAPTLATSSPTDRAAGSTPGILPFCPQTLQVGARG